MSVPHQTEKPSKKSLQKEYTKNEIINLLGIKMAPSSFRQCAAECGILQRQRIEWVAGRRTGFFPSDSVDLMRALLGRKQEARASWKKTAEK